MVLVAIVSLVFLTFFDQSLAGIYLQSPRGSNNRLNENSADVRNRRRLFDSQNLKRGGYNVGDRTNKKAHGNASNQYSMEYFMGDREGGRSSLLLEWANDMGCGTNEGGDNRQDRINCNIVIQYNCRPPSDDLNDLRDGTSTKMRDYRWPGTLKTLSDYEEDYKKRKMKYVKKTEGIHETFEEYDKCVKRPRNGGLYRGNLTMRYNSAFSTRQNPDRHWSHRYGFECPEERDYFPYWHPTSWRDIAVLSENMTYCKNFYQKESFNVKTKWECIEGFEGTNVYKHWSTYNTQSTCEAAGYQWLEFTNYLELAPEHTTNDTCIGASNDAVTYVWGRAMGDPTLQCLVALRAPECVEAPWSRVNHYGNGKNTGEPLRYEWNLPYFPSGQSQKCVLRLRYNISSEDYDTYHKDWTSNTHDIYPLLTPEGETQKMYNSYGEHHVNAYILGGMNEKSFPVQRGVGKVSIFQEMVSVTGKMEHVLEWENIKGGGSNLQWVGYWSPSAFPGRDFYFDAYIKFVDQVPDLVPLESCGKYYNDWLADCKADEWCHISERVHCDGEDSSYTIYLAFGAVTRKGQKVKMYGVTLSDGPVARAETSGYKSFQISKYPDIATGVNNLYLRLAMNPENYFKTYQDRSHIFLLHKRPAGTEGRVIHNLNVRGKRGNIVQTFPATEYDFFPTDLTIPHGDLVHIQWTGSNSNLRNAAGEGTRGTDRSNIVQIKDRSVNYPISPLQDAPMFMNAKVLYASDLSAKGFLEPIDVVVQMASSGYLSCAEECEKSAYERKVQNQLNNAPASFKGMMLEFARGEYHYMCSRNNNFSNRSQKGSIVVK